jgi:hypothetical protein
LSDFNRDFKNKCPHLFLDGIKDNSLQILFNPLYYNSHGSTFKYVMPKVIFNMIKNIHNEFKYNKNYLKFLNSPKKLVKLILFEIKNKKYI